MDNDNRRRRGIKAVKSTDEGAKLMVRSVYDDLYANRGVWIRNTRRNDRGGDCVGSEGSDGCRSINTAERYTYLLSSSQ